MLAPFAAELSRDHFSAASDGRSVSGAGVDAASASSPPSPRSPSSSASSHLRLSAVSRLEPGESKVLRDRAFDHALPGLARDYYVRVDSNDYSVDPRFIGRLVDVTATLDRVVAVCDGTAVADHQRCWATHAVITAPAHVATAKGLRSAFSAAKRDRERQRAQTLARPTHRVMFRDTSDYDDLFGVDFDPATGEVFD